MTQPERTLGRHRDIPHLRNFWKANVAAGSAADYEHALVALPDLTVGAASGTAGFAASDLMHVKRALLIPEAAITGATAHYFTWQLNWYRAGVAPVSTTLNNGAVTGTGVQTVTLTAITNIVPGMVLTFSGGTAENVMVTAVNYANKTVTAAFTISHADSTNVLTPPLASVAFITGTNASKWVPIQLSGLANAPLKPGDVVTLARVSNDATGLASPAVQCVLELSPYSPAN
jgi:hypothetical protein